jgi:hypothetical protein
VVRSSAPLPPQHVAFQDYRKSTRQERHGEKKRRLRYRPQTSKQIERYKNYLVGLRTRAAELIDLYRPKPSVLRKRALHLTPKSEWSEVSTLIRQFNGDRLVTRKALHLCQGCHNTYDSNGHKYWCEGSISWEKYTGRAESRWPSTFVEDDGGIECQLAAIGCKLDSEDNVVRIESPTVTKAKPVVTSVGKSRNASRRLEMNQRYRANVKLRRSQSNQTPL